MARMNNAKPSSKTNMIGDTNTLNRIVRAAQIIDSTKVLEVVETKEIRLVAVLHMSRRDQNLPAPSASITVKPGDPKFAELDAMIRKSGKDQAEVAQREMKALGQGYDGPDADTLKKIERDSISQKALSDDRDRQLAEQIAAATAVEGQPRPN